MKRVLKVKHTAGVRYIGLSNQFEYIGESIDRFPMYSFDDKKIYLKYHYKDFIFNCRPGYTPTESDFEIVPSLEDVFEPRLNMTERYFGKNILGTDDIIPAQALPLPEPLGILYYFDYVLGSEFDNRLLLML